MKLSPRGALIAAAGWAALAAAWPGGIPVAGLSGASAQAAPRQQNPQQRRFFPRPKAAEDPSVAPADAGQADQNTLPPPEEPERVEADVSSRSVSIKLGFSGTEIIVFGSVDNSRQPSAESGYYDLVVVLEGRSEATVVRRKSNVAGLWINTQAMAFDSIPSYYAIASTRPIEEIAEQDLLAANAIGFDHIRIRPKEVPNRGYSDAELSAYRDAIVRIKEKEQLYIKADYDVTFIGRSLFRTTISLPANIAVGPVDARLYLFRDGKLLSQYASRVMLQRAGIELWLHAFANSYPLFYGLFTVMVALSAGLIASAVFRRAAH